MGLRADPLITEFMAANKTTLRDSDGVYSDWVELHNPGSTTVSLNGWYLTDSSANKTKWQFPAIDIPSRGYVVVFASNKDRRVAGVELHTNFALSNDGEFLALVKPDGVTITSQFSPQYPAQEYDVSYGYAQRADGSIGAAGYFAQPTPGKSNPVTVGGSVPGAVQFSRASGPFSSSVVITLSGAASGQKIRYVAVVPSDDPLPEPTATSPEFTKPLLIDRTVVIRAALFTSDDSARGEASTAIYTKIDPNVATFSSRLPILVVDSMGAGALDKDGVDHPSWMYVYGADATTPVFQGTPDLITPAEITVRGASSANFPKKGFNVKLKDDEGGNRAQALLDLPAHAKWALVGPWAFNFSYINNSLMYSLSNAMGRWAPRTRAVEVFYNGNGNSVDMADYAGLYVLTDRIEPGKERVDIPEMSGKDVAGAALTGGYIFKVDSPSDGEFSWKTRRGLPENGYSSLLLVSPDADDIAPAQRDYLINYVQEMEDALFADRATGWAQRTYLDYIDRSSWVDHHLLNTFAANPDAFERSANFTKDRGGKLRAGPVWDFDRALGSHWDNRSLRHDVWSGVGATDVWHSGWWGVIVEDPEFMQDWIDRWQDLRETTLSNPALLAQVGALANEVGPEAAARDAARWPDNASPYGPYSNQIDRLKSWVTLRAQWIDAQFVAPPTVNPGATLTFTAPSGAQLVYTLDGSDPRSLGGEIAPNAQITATTLTVPATANVNVRSYRAEMKTVLPGSPWSSAVGGPNSSPLTPRARLINISSRAVVGSGENALIAGVVVADTRGKRYLSRAVGPSLAMFGASGYVPDPQLSIFNSSSVELFRNNGWESGPDGVSLPAYSKSVGAFPLITGSRDSALASQISGGGYTVQITSPTDRAGVGLVELYELDSNGRTVNLSTRAHVGTGDAVLIGGFVVQGPAYKRMLIRAVGPTLGIFGVGNALDDSILTVYSGSEVVATNDRWDAGPGATAVAAASKTAGAFQLPANSEDAALLITLPPGPYTVEVRGKDGGEGVALLEIYEVP